MKTDRERFGTFKFNPETDEVERVAVVKRAEMMTETMTLAPAREVGSRLYTGLYL